MAAIFHLPGRNLHVRLLASYALVVSVTLIMVLIALSVLLPSYRTRQTEQRLAELARPTLRVLAELGLRGAPPDEIRAALEEQAEATGLRILVLNRGGIVQADTAGHGSYEGRSIALPPATGLGARARG